MVSKEPQQYFLKLQDFSHGFMWWDLVRLKDGNQTIFMISMWEFLDLEDNHVLTQEDIEHNDWACFKKPFCQGWTAYNDIMTQYENIEDALTQFLHTQYGSVTLLCLPPLPGQRQNITDSLFPMIHPPNLPLRVWRN